MRWSVRFVLDPEHHVAPEVLQDVADPPAGWTTRDAHLCERVTLTPHRVEAEWRFDEAYAAAHPEALDPRHLALLHALLVFKLFDDGELIVPPAQAEAALRWPTTAVPRRALGA